VIVNVVVELWVPFVTTIEIEFIPELKDIKPDDCPEMTALPATETVALLL
jgi:hypothetical protein